MPSCIGAAPNSGCRLIGLRDHVVDHTDLLTTRPSKLTIRQLASPSSVIKGLYYPPGCSQGQGVVAFSRRISDGIINEKSHTDIANDLGLLVRTGTASIGDGSGVKTGARNLMDPDIKGFILHPINVEVSQKTALLIPTMAEFGIMTVEDTNLQTLLFTQVEFMAKRDIIAIMYVNSPHMSGMWAVAPKSGLTGMILFHERDAFLKTLARHVSPDFTILRFFERDIKTFRRRFYGQFDNMGGTSVDELAEQKVSDGSVVLQEPIVVTPEEVQHPSCLRWPKEMMLPLPKKET